MSVPTFIVGTARCGSTMLSNMLREHPGVLSLSEFFSFVSDFDRARLAQILSPAPISGQEFWEFIAAITPLLSLALRHRIESMESIYPCESPAARFSRRTGVPAILHVTLPHLTDDHDRLFDILRDEVSAWPQAHLGVNPLLSADRSQIARVPAELRPFLPEAFEAKAFHAFRLPLAFFGELWSQWVADGLNGLRPLPADRLLTLRYEDFFVDPKRQLDTLATFLGEDFIDEDWSTRCAATVRKPFSTGRDLPVETAGDLTEACRTGFERLRAIGVHYEL